MCSAPKIAAPPPPPPPPAPYLPPELAAKEETAGRKKRRRLGVQRLQIPLVPGGSGTGLGTFDRPTTAPVGGTGIRG